jgi:hypothetical protein
MTRTEERLTDTLSAAAAAVREDRLRPLAMPQRRRARRAWAVPVAAAAAVVLVAALTAVAARWLPGAGYGPQAAVPAPHRYYVEADLNLDRPVVRSTATGKVTATVPVPGGPAAASYDVITSAANGTFFVTAFLGNGWKERLYRFQLTASGHLRGFAAVPGGVFGAAMWTPDALAASPDGKLVAISFGSLASCSAGQKRCPSLSSQSDYIVVINTATGARSVWRGGLTKRGQYFSIGNLSWANRGRELVFLGQWCDSQVEPGSESCGTTRREVRTLDPGSGGGPLDSGRILVRQSARYPFIAQAVISPDGSTVTAIVLTGPVVGNANVSGALPRDLSVDQVSVATGRLLRVLYRRDLGDTSGVNGVPDPLALMPDATGQHWMLNGGICSGHCDTGFNGWIDNGQLVPLQPTDGRLAEEAW